MLATAIKLASEKFENKLDNGGKPYILHCLRVMMAVSIYNDEELMQIAVLHDIIEDSDVSAARLVHMEFSDRVVDAIIILTHSYGEDYHNYIKRISLNKDATRVKLEDLKDNSKKYHKAFLYLSD